MPYGASSERVLTHIGPGQPREVLSALLNGSKFDYIILGVTGNPGAVQKVILTTRQSTGQPVSTAQNNNPGQPQQIQNEDEEQVPVEEQVQPNPEPEVSNENQQEPQQVTPGRFRPMPPQGDLQENGNATEGQQNGVKSPEQLLQELQKMQQQQQQYQQQLNPANQDQQQQPQE